MMNKQNGLTLLQILIAIVLVAGALIRIKSYQSHQATIEAKAIAAKEAENKARLAAETDKLYSDLDNLAQRWTDAVTLADSTPRMSLPERVAELQKIKQEAENLKVNECLNNPKNSLILSMDATVNGFLVFLHNQNKQGDLAALAPLQKGRALFKDFAQGLSDCKAKV